MRRIPFGHLPFERGQITISEVDAGWRFLSPVGSSVVTHRLDSVGASSRREVPENREVHPVFVGIHSHSFTGGDYWLHLGATLLRGEPNTLTIEVCTAEDAIPAEHVDRLLAVVKERTAGWSRPATLRLDHAFWHPVDSKLVWYEMGAEVLVALLELELITATDPEIATRAFDTLKEARRKSLGF